jgi:lysozyme
LLILDLSNNNGEPDWARLKAQGIAVVYLKATEGVHFADGTFAARRTAANKNGIAVGAYHFARPDSSDAVTQARAFAKAVGKLGVHDLRPALDFEASASTLSPVQMVAWARQFNQEVKRLLGALPVFYTYTSFAQMLHAVTPIGAGLWLASYSRNDGAEHPFTVPAPWRGVVAHQFSSKCSVGGCAGLVDLSNAKSLLPLRAFPVKHVVAKVLPYLGRH